MSKTLNLVTKYSFLILLVGFLVFAVCACGKKGSPKPPEETAPSAAGAFDAVAKDNAIILSWTAPETNALGEPLDDLVQFVVMRKLLKSGSSSSRFQTIAKLVVVENKEAVKESSYKYTDKDVQKGRRYEYIVVPVNSKGVSGSTGLVLRVIFFGKSSVIEAVSG